MNQRPATGAETERLTWHCERCQQLIARQVTLTAVVVGPLVFRNRTVAGICAACGKNFRWSPSPLDVEENST